MCPKVENSTFQFPVELNLIFISVELGDIVEIRTGWKTDTFNKVEASENKKRSRRKDYRGTEERNCFSIIYGDRRDTWDLVAPSAELAEKWVIMPYFEES